MQRIGLLIFRKSGGDTVALRPGGWKRLAGRAGSIRAVTGRGPLLVAGLAWLLALAAVAFLARASMAGPSPFHLLDLYVYRDGGRTILNGGPLYSMRSVDALLFTYPPAAAVLATPLALMSFQVAQFAWLPMIYVPLLVVTWMSFRPLLARAGRYAPAVLAGLFTGAAFLLPVRQEIHYGQVDIFLVALCLVDCAAKRPRWPRGALIGLATAIKLVPGVFIIYLFVTGRRKAAGVAALSFAGVTGVSWLISPKDSVAYWTSAIFSSSRLGQNTQAANQSARGMILRLFAPAVAPTVVWLIVALLVAVAGFAAARAVARRGQEMAGIAITGLLAALLSPVAWIHHLCWVVVAIAVLTGDGRNWRRVAGAAAAAVLFASDLPIWGKELLSGREAPIPATRFMEASFGLAALVLIWVIWALRPAGAGEGQPEVADSSGSAADGALLAGSRHR
jgi:alpha-1,2-mannosyltransferase